MGTSLVYLPSTGVLNLGEDVGNSFLEMEERVMARRWTRRDEEATSWRIGEGRDEREWSE